VGDHFQRWQPDTCDGFDQGQGCSFIQVFDDEDPPDKVKVKLHKTEKKCKKHDKYPGPDAYIHAVDDNSHKNRVWAILKAAEPSLQYADYHWSFNDDGVLTFPVADIPQFTWRAADVRAFVQGLCDKEFGPGKVLVR